MAAAVVITHLAIIAFLRTAPAAQRDTRAIMMRVGRHDAIRAEEIPVSVSFYRTAKAALRNALAAEAGVLSEDAAAMVSALYDVNPTRPDPATDADLYSGSFDIASALSHSAGAGKLTVDDDGGLQLSAAISEDGDATLALTVAGSVRPTADAELSMTVESVSLAAADDACPVGVAALVAVCSAATGLRFEAVESTWMAQPPLPSLRLQQLYLDQELHVVQWVLGDEAESAPDEALALREDRLVVLFKQK